MKLKILLCIAYCFLSLVHGTVSAMLTFPKNKILACHIDFDLLPSIATTDEPGSDAKNNKVGGNLLNSAQAYRLYDLMLKNESPAEHLMDIPCRSKNEGHDSADVFKGLINFNAYVPFCKPGEKWDWQTYINVMVYALQKNDPVGLAWAQEFFKNTHTIIQQIEYPDRKFRPLQEALDMTALSGDISAWLQEQKVDIKQTRKSTGIPNFLKQTKTFLAPTCAIIAVGICAVAAVGIKKLYDKYGADESTNDDIVSDTTVDEQKPAEESE